MAVTIDDLTEVAVVVGEPDRTQGEVQIACRLQMISSEDSEPAGVEFQESGKPKLHAEVGDARVLRLGRFEHLSMEPCNVRDVLLVHRQAQKPIGPHLVEERVWILVDPEPEERVDLLEQRGHIGVPSPPEVGCDLLERA